MSDSWADDVKPNSNVLQAYDYKESLEHFPWLSMDFIEVLIRRV